MKKVILTIIIVLSVIISISAHDFSENGIYYNILSEEDLTCEVTFKGYTCNNYYEYIGHFSIPEQVTYNSKVYKVVAIGNQAFWGNNAYGGLTSISIPNTIKTIGSEAFGLTRLKTVTIPESVTSVGECAFYNCSALTTVYFNAINCLKMGRFNYNAFKDCDKLTNVYFGANVNIIPDYGFVDCSGLTSITIPNSVTTIGQWAFDGCTNLKSVNIGNSVTNISHRAFSACNNLSSISLPITLKLIGKYAFSNCDKLTMVTIPESVDSIGDGAFAECTNLKTINLNAIKCIHMGSKSYPTLKGCTALTAVNFGDKVNRVPDYAFYNCNGIESVTLPETVTYIGDYAFYNLNNISSITLPKTLTTIGDYAFGNSIKLSSVVIPNLVKYIGNYAFYGCDNLRSLTIGEEVTFIGDKAFSYPDKTIWLTYIAPTGYKNANGNVNIVSNDSYSSLTNVSVYPHISSMFEINGIKYVPVSPSERTCDIIDCLYDTTMTTIKIGPTIAYKGIEMKLNKINRSAFIDNYYIKTADITFGGNIEKAAFSSCDSLENVMVNAPSIGVYAFYNCDGLKKVAIGSNVNSIGDNSFSNCSSLNDLSDGENVKFVGNNAFSDCSELKEVVLGENVETIGDFAFLNCTGLERLELGCNLKAIGNQAFANCTSLIKLKCKALTPPVCGEQALDDINKWTCELYVPGASIPVYQAADQWKDFFFMYDGVEGIKADNNAVEVARYDIHGRLLSEPSHGINIVKYSDGTTRKEIIKE